MCECVSIYNIVFIRLYMCMSLQLLWRLWNLWTTLHFIAHIKCLEDICWIYLQQQFYQKRFWIVSTKEDIHIICSNALSFSLWLIPEIIHQRRESACTFHMAESIREYRLKYQGEKSGILLHRVTLHHWQNLYIFVMHRKSL